jgi:hypothetical protein
MDATRSLMDMIDDDDFKSKVPEGTYLDMCNKLNAIYKALEPHQPPQPLLDSEANEMRLEANKWGSLKAFVMRFVIGDEPSELNLRLNPAIGVMIDELMKVVYHLWKPSIFKQVDVNRYDWSIESFMFVGEYSNLKDHFPLHFQHDGEPIVLIRIFMEVRRMCEMLYQHRINKLKRICVIKNMIASNISLQDEFDKHAKAFNRYSQLKITKYPKSKRNAITFHDITFTFKPISSHPPISAKLKTPYWRFEHHYSGWDDLLHKDVCLKFRELIQRPHEENMYSISLPNSICNGLLSRDYIKERDLALQTWKYILNTHSTKCRLVKGAVGLKASYGDRRTYDIHLDANMWVNRFEFHYSHSSSELQYHSFLFKELPVELMNDVGDRLGFRQHASVVYNTHDVQREIVATENVRE